MTAAEYYDSEAPLLSEIERLHRRVERERSARLEAERIAEEATRVSIQDPLTGLANRTLLTATLENELARAARYDRDIALFYLDLDRFKLINDTYGHEAGDAVLLAVSDTLSRTTRDTDTVGRLGGDEFLVIAPDIGEPDAMRLAERIARAIEGIRPVTGAGINCGASVGVAMLGGDLALEAGDFVRRADVAMYAAKEAGAEVRLFDGDLRAVADTHRSVRRELPGAIERRELVAHHQPIVATGDRRMVALEALARWPHGDGTFRPPMDFIPVAEDDGQIVELGMLIAEVALHDIRRWQHAWSRHDIAVAINVSPRELAHPDYAYRLTSLITDAGVATSNVIVEVTESALLEAGRSAEHNLRALRRVGVLTALDDFGTGYSSLGRLREHDFDVLKIDRSFTAGIEDSEDARAVVGAVLGLARAFDVDVIAEGVETEAQLEAVAELGCQAAQGWLFDPAKPIDEIGDPDQYC